MTATEPQISLRIVKTACPHDSPDNRNVNALTSARLTDMGGGSTFYTNLIQFARVER